MFLLVSEAHASYRLHAPEACNTSACRRILLHLSHAFLYMSSLPPFSTYSSIGSSPSPSYKALLFFRHIAADGGHTRQGSKRMLAGGG